MLWGKFEFKSVIHAILIKDKLHKYFLNEQKISEIIKIRNYILINCVN